MIFMEFVDVTSLFCLYENDVLDWKMASARFLCFYQECAFRLLKNSRLVIASLAIQQSKHVCNLDLPRV